MSIVVALLSRERRGEISLQARGRATSAATTSAAEKSREVHRSEETTSKDSEPTPNGLGGREGASVRIPGYGGRAIAKDCGEFSLVFLLV